MNKQSITSLIAAAALAGTFGIAHAQGSATAVPGTTNNQLSSGAQHDGTSGTHSMDKKDKSMKSAGKAGTTMNSNTNPRGTGTVENNGTQATPGGTGAAGTMSGSTSGSSSTTMPSSRNDAGTMNSNTNPRGTGTVENNSNQPTTGGTGAVKK